MRSSKSRGFTAVRVLLAGAIMVSALFLSCGEAGDPKPPDFYITVKLKTGYVANAVHRLEVVLYDATRVLGEREGDAEGGSISWQTRDNEGVDEFAISMTNEYFLHHAIEVSPETWEIDVPFHGGTGDEANFNIRATVYWSDADGEENDIGQGLGRLMLPMTDTGGRVTVEVECRATPDWSWTCITGCAPSVNRCDVSDDCGSGFWECVEGCCIAQ